MTESEKQSAELTGMEHLEMISRLPCVLYRCLNDSHWTMTYLSEGCHELTGYHPSDLIHNNVLAYNDIILPEDQAWVVDVVERALATKTAFTHEYRIRTADGLIKWVWEQGLGIWDADDNLVAIEGFITDITSQKNSREQLKETLSEKDKELVLNVTLLNEYRKAVDAGAIVSKTNTEGVITYANKLFCDISGYSLNELVGQHHNLIRHPDMPSVFFKQLWSTISSKQVWKGVIKNRAKNGDAYFVQSTIVPILKPDGEIYEYMSIRHDITDLIRQSRRIQRQTTDHLTQLPNRQKLIEDLQLGEHWKLAVFNIERFREINEYYGLDTGDSLLVKTANILQRIARDYSLKVYKLSGDEFAILSDNSRSNTEFVEICYQCLHTFEDTPLEIDGNLFSLSMVVGISQERNYYINAEIAMNHAREHGEQLVFFDNEIDIKDQLVHNISWTQKLKSALKEDRIQVFVQPIVANHAQNSLRKYECLVRMIDEDGTVISPAAFLDIAKKSRLYPEITRVVVAQAFGFFSQYPQAVFSINLTLEDILNRETMKFLQDQIETYQIGGQLILEIVESEGIENYEQVSRFITLMQGMGCRIAIDDFGTGYSNFDYLMRLNVDIIKIDGSIIRNIDQDRNAQVVTELVVSFAQRLGIETIAEFVHSKEVLDTVTDMQIDYSQGFYLAEPCPLSYLETL